MRKERIVLEHHSDVALLGRQLRDRYTVDQDFAAIDIDETGQSVEGCGLSRAAGAKEGHELPALDTHRKVLQCNELAIRLADVSEVDRRPG